MAGESFNELVDLDGLKSLMALFHQAMGIPMGIVDPEGEILVSTESQEFCTCFQLCGSKAPYRCRKSEASIQARLGGGDYLEYRCDSGLWDVAVPILVEDCHLATLFLGPFFHEDDPPDLDRFRRYAQEAGIDLEAYLDRVSRVPVFSRERVRQIMAYYLRFVEMLSRQSLDRLKLIEEIRDRIQSEVDLANHVQLLSTLIESIPSPIFYKDRQRRFTGCNRAFADLLGLDKERILGRTLDEIHPRRPQSWLKQCEENDNRLLEHPGIHVEEDTFVGEDGKERCHTITLSTFRNAREEVAGIVGVIQDLTDWKRIENELREAQSIYQRVIANAQGIPYRLHDRSHAYEVFGPGFEDLFGMPPEQLTRDKLRSLIQECVVLNDTWNSPEEYKGLFRSRSVERYRADIRIKTPAGDEKWLNDCSLPVYDKETGEYTGSLGILQDITYRKKVEEALRNSEKRFRELAELLPEVVFEMDGKGNARFLNEQAYRLFGYRREDFPEGLNVLQHIAQEDWPRAKANIQRVLEGGKSISNRYQAIHRDGSRFPIMVSAVPILENGKASGLRGILIDMTESQKAAEAMAQASRMEATATLAGGIAHDFNNLMLVVMGNAEMLQEELGAQGPAARMLSDIVQAATQAGSLAQQMLAYAQGGKYQPKIIDLNRIIEESAQLQESSIAKWMTLERQLAGDLWNINGDPTQMSQVVMNLVLNAKEAIADNGVIRVKTENVLGDSSGEQDPGAFQAGKRYVCLTVEDTGCGMDAGTQSRIFEPFFSTKFQGRGLGLASVYGIVHLHDGQIQVKSRPGEGSIFQVYLPACLESPEPPVQTMPGDTREVAGVLVVDDEPLILDVTKKMLDQMGYRVFSARSGTEALQIVTNMKGKIHLTILDMEMPGMGGTQAFFELRKIDPDLRILICSGYDLDDRMRALMKAGAAGLIRKPFRMALLSEEVRKILDGERSK